VGKLYNIKINNTVANPPAIRFTFLRSEAIEYFFKSCISHSIT
jgi:hypothetical protein